LTEYYLSNYQGRMINRIMDALIAREPGYQGSPLHQFHQLELAHRSQLSHDAQLRLCQNEMGLIPALE